MSNAAAARPTVSVFDAADEKNVIKSVALPGVMVAPIRPDVVQFVHTNMAKNSRQAYAVHFEAGMVYSAESWGTGRAVSRIPRIAGGGTSRCGQAAFGNMCRGGRMFAPTKTWRNWHRRINVNQKRYAVASALAASAVPALVMARGHRVSQVAELPLVVSDAIGDVTKTAKALELLARHGADEDVDHSKNSKKVRRGKGKMRNRRYQQRKGPLVVYAGDGEGLEKAFRNISGIELAHVDRLNLLSLAPGGHMGRFIIWTESAFAKLDSIYGTATKDAALKSGYRLPTACMTNADLTRLINSDEIQSVVRPAQALQKRRIRKKNPLKNLGAMVRLNPYALAHRRSELRAQAARAGKKAEIVAAKRAAAKDSRGRKAERRAFYAKLTAE